MAVLVIRSAGRGKGADMHIMVHQERPAKACDKLQRMKRGSLRKE
jgi:hypothetical protein